MDGQDPNAMILEVGRMVIEDPEYRDDRWQKIALVATMGDGQREITGYQYFADGGFEAAAPEEFGAILRKLRDLRNVMESANGDLWKQCLIQITKPDYDVKIQFEYDDAERWSPKEISLDMSAFANAIRP